MIPDTHKARWEAFIAQHPDPAALDEEQKIAMFRHGWETPDRNLDEHLWAVMCWQMAVMEEVEWFNLGGPPPRPQLKTVETVACAPANDDPDLFRF